MTNPRVLKLTTLLEEVFQRGGIAGFVLAEREQNVIEVADTDGRRYTVTVANSFVPMSDDESDDDGDDDEQPADGESFDGGFGPGSYFNHAMRKDD